MRIFVGTTRSPAKTGALRALGVEPVIVDPAAATNRLRTEGTDHLLAAGRAVGIRTFVARAGWTPRYASWRTGFTDGLN